MASPTVPAKISRHSITHFAVHTEIMIDAAPEKVWRILIDAENMGSWSSSFQGFFGELGKGNEITLKVRAMGRDMEVKHTLTYYEEGKLLGWSDTPGPGIRDNHKFIVEDAADGRTRFIQTDAFKGWGVPIWGWLLINQVKSVYPQFNYELKEKAERHD